MRAPASNGARLLLLAAPTVLAFFSGGYFEQARDWVGLGAWSLVAVGLVLRTRKLSLRPGGWLAVGGLGAFAAWTLLSIVWSPVAGNAYHASQVVVLYMGALLAATLLLSARGSQRLVEPALTAGTLVVIGYGVSARLLPGLIHFTASVTARGRLEQPLTYWNAMGELAALGLVLAVRLAGDVTRTAWLRMASAAATVPLGMGLYLTFSRGALFACAAGLVTLFVVAPTRAQLRAVLLGVCAAGLAALSTAGFGGVTSLAGSQVTRERQGAVVLALLVILMVGVALTQRQLTRRQREGYLRLPRRTSLITLGLVCAGFAVTLIFGATESSTRPLAPGAARLTTLQSDRYDYWGVALRVFALEPLHGVGAGNWSVYWLHWRPSTVGAEDAHSLPLQTAAELGLVGVALLGVFLGGVAIAARQAHRVAPTLAAGPTAALVVYLAHAPLDWDWEMPAVTLIALVLVGLLLVAADELRVKVVPERVEAAAQRPAESVMAGSEA